MARVRSVVWGIACLSALTIVWHARSITQSGPWYGDSPNHLLNAIFIHDAARDAGAALSDPMGYAVAYYGRFPALSLGYHPPVFPLVAAVFIFLFGVTHLSAQLAMLFLTILGGVACFAWLRRCLEAPFAFCGATVVVCLPLTVFWGQTLNLEMPAMTFVLIGAWAFERITHNGEAPVRDYFLFSVALLLAVWTKQHALFCIPVFAIALLVRRRADILGTRRGILTVFTLLVACLGILLVTSMIGGNAVSQAGLADVEHLHKRLVLGFWTYYPGRLPYILGWPLLLATAFGFVISIKQRSPLMVVPCLWVVFFYLSHSYPYPHAMRYACLWIPPLVALAMFGVSRLPGRLPWVGGRRVRVSSLVAMGLATHTALAGLGVNVAPYPPQMRDAVETASRRLGRYSCLSLVSDWPPRPAVYFRLAQDPACMERAGAIANGGRLLRAEQVIQPTNGRWPLVEELSQRLRSWNVAMILFEFEDDELPVDHHDPLVRIVARIIANGEFRIIEKHEVHIPVDDSWRTYSHSMWETPPVARRHLILCERIEPLPWNDGGGPDIRPARTPLRIE